LSSRLSLRSGKTLWSGFKLGRFLGKGAFGQVWEAESDEGGNLALKFLHCHSNIAAVQEVRNILNVRQLSHPNLIRVEKVWADRGYMVVVMELADGSLHDLATICQGDFGTPLPASQVCLYLSQAAEGLDYLNARMHRIGNSTFGIQHCDVKPSNLLVCGDTVKLSDFGLSSLITASTMPHRRAGTTAYAAPEVYQGQLTVWSDQYALAVTYCELRGGRRPFPTPPRFGTAYTPPQPDLSMLPEVEQHIVARALCPSPSERWKSCSELMGHLTRLNAK
jgi:serine/threonine protein kinase